MNRYEPRQWWTVSKTRSTLGLDDGPDIPVRSLFACEQYGVSRLFTSNWHSIYIRRIVVRCTPVLSILSTSIYLFPRRMRTALFFGHPVRIFPPKRRLFPTSFRDPRFRFVKSEKNTRIFAKSFPRTENSSRENENRDRFEVSSLPLRFFSRTLYFLLTKIARFNLLNTIRIIFQLIIKFQRIDKVTSI